MDWERTAAKRTPIVCPVCRYVVECARHQRCAGCGAWKICGVKGWRVCADHVEGCGPFCPSPSCRPRHAHG